MTSITNHRHSAPAVLTGHAPPAITALIPGPWARRALCADADPEIFFRAHDDPATEARRTCAQCPVRADCLQFALDAGERHGIWGGLDPAERTALRRKLRGRKASATPRRGAA